VLDARPRDADGVAFLERVLPDRVCRHLPREHYHRDRVHVSRRNAGDGIGDAWAGCDQRDAGLVRRPRVTIGRVHRTLLVAHQYVLDGFLLEQLVVDVEHRATGIAEDVSDAFFLEAADDDFRTRELHGFTLHR
jgi:hypothetical protein